MIKIIADSTFGISETYANENDIKIVKLKMVLDGKVFEEGFEPSWETFYKQMEKSKNFPTTSQPSPQDFIDKIEEILSADPDAEIIILTIATRLSGTHNSAKIATESFPDKKIIAVDSRQATTCGRFMIEEIVDAINGGANYEQVLSLIDSLQSKLKIQFIPKTLEYLKRGGRIGALGASFATLLHIKPLFTFADNELTVKKVLGQTRAITECVSSIPKKIKKLAVCYIYDKSNISLLTDKINQKINDVNAEIVAIEPVFGVHVGIGAIGIATLEE